VVVSSHLLLPLLLALLRFLSFAIRRVGIDEIENIKLEGEKIVCIGSKKVLEV
jgi:hypothetical protein